MDGVIDTATALQRVDGDMEFLRELLGVFLEDAPHQLATIRDAIARADATALAHAAHSLKGSAASLAATAVTAAAHSLELLARDGNFVECVRVSTALEADLQRVEVALASLGTLPTPEAVDEVARA